jgi:hypothetical protein
MTRHLPASFQTPRAGLPNHPEKSMPAASAHGYTETRRSFSDSADLARESRP